MRTNGAVSGRPKTAMGMRSPVYWALLGLVIEHPSYGYKLKTRYEHAYGEALPIHSDSHIYTALNELERRGLVEEVAPDATPIDGSRQPRPAYRATEEGVSSYRSWLLKQLHAGSRQSQLFVRQLAVLAREPRMALEVLDSLERACLEQAVARSSSSANGSAPAGGASHLFADLLAEEQRLALEARLPWIEYARTKFEALLGAGR
jgi:DNA-binding PadR family transcriptional regulator